MMTIPGWNFGILCYSFMGYLQFEIKLGAKLSRKGDPIQGHQHAANQQQQKKD